MEFTAVILAGGLGTRLRSVVNDVPKPMAPILGRPFLEYLIDYWITQGVSDFILSIGYKCDDIINHFGTQYKSAKITYIIEDTPLGTGGGVVMAAKKIGLNNQFILLNGDTFFEVSLTQLWQYHEGKESDLTFSLFKNTDTTRYMGIGLQQDGSILNLKGSQSIGDSFVNGGVYLINSNLFANEIFISGNKYSFEADLIPYFLSQNKRIYGLNFESFFIDIGVPDDYFRASKLFTTAN